MKAFKPEDIRMVVEKRRVVFSKNFSAWVVCEDGRFLSGQGWRPYESHRQERFPTEEKAVEFLENLEDEGIG